MPRKPKKIPMVLTEENINCILQSLLIGNPNQKVHSKDRLFSRVRNYFMVYLALGLGLRPKETRMIKISDIDFKEHSLYIPPSNNKQRQEDSLPIPYFVFDKLTIYLSYLRKIDKETVWLFPNTKNYSEPIDRSTHIRFFRTALRRCKLYRIAYIDEQGKPRGNLSLYSLRHSFGTYAYKKLKDIPKTASLLRHYDWQYRSTLVYSHTLSRVSRKSLFEQIYEI